MCTCHNIMKVIAGPSFENVLEGRTTNNIDWLQHCSIVVVAVFGCNAASLAMLSSTPSRVWWSKMVPRNNLINASRRVGVKGGDGQQTAISGCQARSRTNGIAALHHPRCQANGGASASLSFTGNFHMVPKKLETLQSTLSCNLAARVMHKQSVRNPTAGPTLHFNEGAQVGQQRGDQQLVLNATTQRWWLYGEG